MLPDFEPRLRALAEVILRVGVNLQRGQRLLIAEPYELQGVARSAEVLVSAIESVVGEIGGGVDVIWGDGARLREYAERADWRGFAQLVDGNATQMRRHLDAGGAFLFLIGSQPRLLDGIPADRVTELHRLAWEHFGPVVQRLIDGETQWTLAPAPSPAWASAAFADLPSPARLASLWETVFESCRVGPRRAEAADPVATWQEHLAILEQRRATLNARRIATLRYLGDGTDLTVKLPPKHVWRTAAATTRTGVAFVQNLPTEEVFTAPHKDSAEGIVRVARPINHAGALLDGIELEFKHGDIVSAAARTGHELLQRLLETDDGARRLGEVALVENAGGSLSPELSESGPKAAPTWRTSGRLYYHPLLDENTSNHIALGEAYRFCLDSIFSAGLNRSLVHVDLPLTAGAAFTP